MRGAIDHAFLIHKKKLWLVIPNAYFNYFFTRSTLFTGLNL
jgi:hypothetical protein